MAKTLRARPGGEQLRLAIINNFNLPDDDAPATSALPVDMNPDGLNVLFAGNVGRFQGLDVVVDAMTLLKERADIRFVIMGDGAAKSDLQRRVAQTGANIEFVPHQPVAVAKAVMAAACLGFVSLMPEVIRYAYPSKTMTYLSQGCPLLVAVEEGSELARSVVADDTGFHVPTGDATALAALLEYIADQPRDDIRIKSANAHAKAAREYDQSVVMAHWTDLLAGKWGAA
jgi:glycosyltransferase involved in cell wall biosynthesis